MPSSLVVVNTLATDPVFVNRVIASVLKRAHTVKQTLGYATQIAVAQQALADKCLISPPSYGVIFAWSIAARDEVGWAIGDNTSSMPADAVINTWVSTLFPYIAGVG
jgi:hypothetical protein